MDVFDQATELERLDRESALMRARAAIDRGGPEMIDGVACCRDCGEPIPLKRLEALPGVGLCRACQEEREGSRLKAALLALRAIVMATGGVGLKDCQPTAQKVNDHRASPI